MKTVVPLKPDPAKQKPRQIDFDAPSDLTQDEFWTFVWMIGSIRFGETIDKGDGQFLSSWSPSWLNEVSQIIVEIRDNTDGWVAEKSQEALSALQTRGMSE